MSTSISPLQLKAWMVGNASYHVPGGQAYRNLCIELYRQDISERISALFAKLDVQNDFLDALLTEGRVGCDEPVRIPPTSPARSEQPLRAA
jgi:hypothetical protein